MSQLAINGGSPVSEQPVPYHRPPLSDLEAEAARRSIESKMVAGPGPFAEKVERHLESSWDVPRVLTVTSCTHAMELALQQLELNGGEVIVPSFTYVSTALAVLQAGGTPVFCDIDPETLTLTPGTLEPARTPATRAVIMVHYGGYPGPTEEVVQYCRKHDLHVIEDAAQVFGSRRNNRPAGTRGRFGAFSFHGTKSLTCGEGGLLLVNREKDVSDCEMIRDKGTDRSATRLGDVDRYTWRSRGSSYVLSDILASILWEQIQRWPSIRDRRLEVQQTVRDGIRSLDGSDHFRLLTPPANTEENGHLTGFLLDDPEPRDWLLTALQAEGVEAREHYHPLHRSPFAREHLTPPERLPHTERVAASLVRIPAHPEMSDADVETVLRGLEKVYPHLNEKIG